MALSTSPAESEQLYSSKPPLTGSRFAYTGKHLSEISLLWLSDFQGFNLLEIAFTESQGSAHQSQSLSRQLYIDALSYLLKGLPLDLTQQEAHTIRSSLPPEIKFASTARRSVEDKAKPSLLHRGLASTIMFLCVIVRLLLPYIKYLFAMIYRYERSHHVSERVFSSSMSTADSLGRKSLELVSTALGHEIVMDGLAYCVDGVRGGLTEGLGEGLKVIEMTPKS